jgi:hypothetical protein
VQTFSSQRAFVGRYLLCNCSSLRQQRNGLSREPLFWNVAAIRHTGRFRQCRRAMLLIVMPTIAAGCGFAVQESSIGCSQGRR